MQIDRTARSRPFGDNMPLSAPSQTKPESEKTSSARSIPQIAKPSADLLPPAIPQASKDRPAIQPQDPFGGVLDCLGTLETAVIARLKSYESDLHLLKANAEKAVDESTKLARRLLEVTIALNNKATTVASTQQKLDAILVSLIEEQMKVPTSVAGIDSTMTPAAGAPQDQTADMERMQATIDSQARQIEVLEEQLKADRVAAKRKVEELDAELQRARLQHALAGDRSFGRAA